MGLSKWLERRGWSAEWVQAHASILQTIAVVATILITLFFTVRSINQVQTGLHSAAAAEVYTAQLEINKLMVEDDDLQPYFYEERRPPSADEDPVLRRKLDYAAGAHIDFFESVRYQIARGAFQADREAWGGYFVDAFATSPILCEQLRANLKWYGGASPGYLWADYAQEPCKKWITG